MDFVIPKTKVEAYATLADRRFHNKPMLKYDMFLTGLVYCSDEEFEYRSSYEDIIDGVPCLCKYDSEKCRTVHCVRATQETFAMKWDDKLGN